jgi:hypothetical protein
MAIILSDGENVSINIHVSFHLVSECKLTVAEVKKVGLTFVVFRESFVQITVLAWMYPDVV